jgi:SRSO17 transposase
LQILETVPEMKLTFQETNKLVEELSEYHKIYSPFFQRREQREWSEIYLRGLLLEIPRKSIEPIVLATKGADINTIRAMQQFVSEGRWEDEKLLQQHWQEVDSTLGEENGVLTLDGSDFAKQGQASVGVKRQYCGELGKRANCQAGVFLGYASTEGYTLLDRRLYLPEEWVSSEEFAERRQQCGVPAEIGFKTKLELSWEMIQAQVKTGVLRYRWLTCDEAFGRDTTLLDQIASTGIWYFAEVPHDTHLWQQRPETELPVWTGRGRKPTIQRLVAGESAAQTVLELVTSLSSQQWSRHCIKEGSKGPIVADFACLRVTAVREGLPGPEVWLVVRRNLIPGELKTFLCNAPIHTPIQTLVWVSGMRWPIETCFEEGKQYLGMGDYEVRSWLGWHHHMTLCILAHHFLVRLQLRLKKISHAHFASSSSAVKLHFAQTEL